MNFQKTICLLTAILAFSANAQFSARLDQVYLDHTAANHAAIPAAVEGYISMFYNRSWSRLPGGPSNVLLNGALPSSDGKKGFGFSYLREAAGFSMLQNAAISYSYKLKFSENTALGLGLSLGILHQGFDVSKAVYMDANDQAIQAIAFGPSVSRADLRVSAYLQSGRFSLGVSNSRLPKPRFDYSYYNYTAAYALQNLSTAMIAYDWKVTDKVSLKPFASAYLYDLDYIRYSGNLSVFYRDQIWLGLSCGDAGHWGGNAGFKPHEGVRIGYQISYPTGEISRKYGPVNEVFLSIGLGHAGADGKRRKSEIAPSEKSGDNEVQEDTGKPRYKAVTVKSIADLENEGPGLDTSGITIAGLDSSVKTRGIFLVAGLHSDEHNADNQIRQLYQRGYYSFKFYDPANRSYYVYLKEFKSKSEASRYLMNYDTGLPQAWIREVR